MIVSTHFNLIVHFIKKSFRLRSKYENNGNRLRYKRNTECNRNN